MMAFTRESTVESFRSKKEIDEFLHGATAKQIIHKQFLDDRILTCLSFLVDIFESVNSVNLALQGRKSPFSAAMKN